MLKPELKYVVLKSGRIRPIGVFELTLTHIKIETCGQ